MSEVPGSTQDNAPGHLSETGSDTCRLSKETLLDCIRILEAVAADSMILSQISDEDRIRMMMAAGRMIRPDKLEIRRRLKAGRRSKWDAKRKKDRTARASTQIRASRADSVFVPPEADRLLDAEVGVVREELIHPRACYICKEEYQRRSTIFTTPCARSARLSTMKRFQTAPLPGRVALITGARLKIGYQSALMLLARGRERDRYHALPAGFRPCATSVSRTSRNGEIGLRVHGLDLRHSPSVEAFTRLTSTGNGIGSDFLINNAAPDRAQAAWILPAPPRGRGTAARGASGGRTEASFRPRGVQGDPRGSRPGKARVTARPGSRTGTAGSSSRRPGVTRFTRGLSQIPYACDDALAAFARALSRPAGCDADLQQLDLRAMNSWRMRLDDVPTAELLEVQLVNSIAPFILCSKLEGADATEPDAGDRHVVECLGDGRPVQPAYKNRQAPAYQYGQGRINR